VNSNISYILIKKNIFFINNILKKNNQNINNNYFKVIIMDILYKYIYINIFLKNILIKKTYSINKSLIIEKIFLPTHCIYQINLNDYLNKNNIKIIPFISIKLLKRLNIRHSYKINLRYSIKNY